MRSYEERETIVSASFSKKLLKIAKKGLTLDTWYLKKVKHVKSRASHSQTTYTERGIITQWSTYTKDLTTKLVHLRKLEHYFTSTGSCRSK